MRVLHVLDISIPMLAGYTSRSRYIVNSHKALGMDPVVLTSVRHQNDEGVAMEELDGIRYHRSHAQKRLDRAVVKEALEINELRRRIVEVAKIEKPDLIHGHSSILCGIPAFLASRQLGLPCVYEIRAFWEDASVDHGTSVEGSPKYVAIQKAETLLARNADALIGICQGIKKELVHRGIDERSVFVIPNGVDVDRFAPRARDEALAQRLGLSGKTVVAYIGTFANFEGVPLLVRALIDLIRHGRDDLRGLIVGEGTTYEECRKLAADAGLSDRILHPGKVPHSEVGAMYSVVDILAYPRHSKRITELVTPLKPLEAMAMEKAVIGIERRRSDRADHRRRDRPHPPGRRLRRSGGQDPHACRRSRAPEPARQERARLRAADSPVASDHRGPLRRLRYGARRLDEESVPVAGIGPDDQVAQTSPCAYNPDHRAIMFRCISDVPE